MHGGHRPPALNLPSGPATARYRVPRERRRSALEREATQVGLALFTGSVHSHEAGGILQIYAVKETTAFTPHKMTCRPAKSVGNCLDYLGLLPLH
jgi:hypothetical protein